MTDTPPPEPMLTVRVAGDVAELAALTLFDHGATAVGEEPDETGLVLLRAGFASSDDATAAADAVASWGEARVEDLVPSWQEQQRAGLTAVTISPFWIAPPWHDSRPPTDHLELRIDPGRAFGHGNHPTTRLLIELLPSVVEPGDHVIDLGTGTGVLGIAAAALDATVEAVDNDDAAVECARSNAERNGVGDRVTVAVGDARTTSIRPDDIVLANVTVDVQRELAVSVRGARRILLSGLLDHQVDEILRLYPQHEASVRSAEGWSVIELRRRPQA